MADRQPSYAIVGDVDLVVVRYDDQVSVLYGRCLHRGALLADGHVDGENLICGLHDWDYRLDTGISAYNNQEVLKKFASWVEHGGVWVDEDEIAAWQRDNPQPYDRDSYQGLYADVPNRMSPIASTMTSPTSPSTSTLLSRCSPSAVSRML